MPKIRVLLIEDNRLLREGTTAVLNEQEDIVAVSTAGNRAALAKARALVPNVVLLDLGLKNIVCLKALESIKKLYPKAEVVVMDLIPAHSDVAEFVNAGVSGFIPKDASLGDFLQTIRSVAKGVKVLPSSLAGSLFSQIVESAIQDGKVEQVIDAVKMTKREQEVIKQLAAGQSIRAISQRLKINVFTVKSQIRNILDKLALHTRLELATYAHKSVPPSKSRKKNRIE